MTILTHLLLSVISVSACISHKCSSSTNQYPSQSTCSYIDKTNNINYVQPCKEGYQCSATTSLITGECVYKPDYTPGTQVAGAKCYYDEDCVPNNICNPDFKCQGFSSGTACMSHLDCNVGLYCSPYNFTCIPQIKIGDTGCTEDAHCVNNAGCQTYSAINPNLNLCTEYFTLPDYYPILGCNSTGSINYLCKSGFCVNLDTSVCYPAPKSSGSHPRACTSNSQCQSTATGKFNLIFDSSCQCGLNADATMYCALMPGDSIYDDYDSIVRKWVDSSSIKKCNTYGRFGNGCIETYWSHSEFKEFNRKMYKAISYPEIVNSDDCVLEWGFPEYYQVMDMAQMLSLAFIGLVIS